MEGVSSPPPQVLAPAVKTFLALQGAESLLGLSSNCFMVGLNMVDWARGRRLTTSDLFMVVLGLSNMGFQCALAGSNCCDFLWQGTYPVHPLCPTLYMLMMLSALYSFWVTAWLCVFYCAKIANFPHPVFQRLKLKITHLVPRLLLGSALLSSGTSLPLAWTQNEVYLKNSTTGFKDFGYHYVNRIFLFSFGYTCPLTMVTVSAAIILTSLCEHNRRVQRHQASFSKPSMEAHHGAAHSVLRLLLLYIFYHALMTVLLTDVLEYGSVMYWACLSVVSCYPLAHSLALIWGNAKLKKALMTISLGARGRRGVR
ncbi:taste receptor type 2 member 40-like [Pleurodeles waltl]|uniref:taste receptor type 2 member 40-like n=1 Tax=Pleurodeles waltl TaxID=8319 RepID=UPI00370982CF